MDNVEKIKNSTVRPTSHNIFAHNIAIKRYLDKKICDKNIIFSSKYFNGISKY